MITKSLINNELIVPKMGTESKKNIKTVIIILDQNFGTLNLVPNSNDIAGVDLNSYTKKALSEFQKLDINSFVALNQELVKESSSEDLKQYLPNIKDVIVYTDLQNTLSSIIEKYKLKTEEIIFVSEDRTLRG
ncbi:MAG TPA: hypothetical protein VHJ38_15495, partial [Nitrososphaeraceae archaeon]|nr:hypothetical protein [Nitrososphaeraceae archaeon]